MPPHRGVPYAGRTEAEEAQTTPGCTGWDASVLPDVARWGKRATEAPEFIRGERHKEKVSLKPGFSIECAYFRSDFPAKYAPVSELFIQNSKIRVNNYVEMGE